MTARRFRIAMVACACAVLLPCASAGAAGHLVTAAGTTPQQIRGAVNAFRDDLGPSHREVDWDDVPDELADPAVLPTDFYASRGLIARGASGDQRVSMDSNDPVDADPDKRGFSDQQAGYASQLKAFSKDRLFAPFGINSTEFTFRTPGGAAGYTDGFGLVFADVDTPGSRVVFLTPDGDSLGSFDVPASSGAGSLSFLGVSFDADERIGAVRVISGTGPIGTVDAPPDNDVVALDDVVYGDPQATPPTPTLAVRRRPHRGRRARRARLRPGQAHRGPRPRVAGRAHQRARDGDARRRLRVRRRHADVPARRGSRDRGRQARPQQDGRAGGIVLRRPQRRPRRRHR